MVECLLCHKALSDFFLTIVKIPLSFIEMATQYLGGSGWWWELA
jgi:hypothetical protein